MKKTKIKIGIDEVGRGPWAGPIVACALAWNPHNMPDTDIIHAVGDSKKITQKKREALYKRLIGYSQSFQKTSTTHSLSSQKTSILNSFPGEGKEAANVACSLSSEERVGERSKKDSNTSPKLFFGVGVVDNFYIDEHGIRAANKEAMRRAICEITRKIPNIFSEISVIIDGRDNYTFDELEKNPLYIIGGDGKVPEIGAASIIAKVFRDKLMKEYATLYPDFSFETNVGYGVPHHKTALQQTHDVTNIHRQSYAPVKKVLEKKEKCLVHICCGPDATIPLMDLKDEYEVIAYWYDPNIQPVAEHEKRYEAFVKVCEIEGVKYIRGDYDVKNFFKKIQGLEHTPERGEKCTECYDMRLERTAKLAREMGIEKWTSSLNNSPHKDMEKMFTLGEKWDKTPYQYLSPTLSGEEREQAAKVLGVSIESYVEQLKVLEEENLPLLEEREFKGEVLGGNSNMQEKLDFLKIAFRKNGGFQRSVEYTKKHDIYRQNYCGCVYSDTFPGKISPQPSSHKTSPQPSPQRRGSKSQGVKKGLSG